MVSPRHRTQVLYADGAKHVAECGGAYWLLDEIAFAQAIRQVGAEAFQVWKLKVTADRKATPASPPVRSTPSPSPKTSPRHSKS